jgi:hypothetical protein
LEKAGEHVFNLPPLSDINALLLGTMGAVETRAEIMQYNYLYQVFGNNLWPIAVVWSGSALHEGELRDNLERKLALSATAANRDPWDQ